MGSLFGFDAKGDSEDFKRKLREAEAEVERNGGSINADRQSGKVEVTQSSHSLFFGDSTRKKEVK